MSLVACSSKKATIEDLNLLKSAQQSFDVIPETLIEKDQNKEIIQLGKKLYFETKLSKSGTISCNSCHNLETFGVDNKATSPGHDGTLGGRNSPTSLNAALHFRQFWDGRAKDVEEQALGPILNPIEHGIKDEKEAVKAINTDEYITLFKDANLELNFKNIGVAIGAFERTLMTPSRFDDFLKGDVFALSDEERSGLRKFMQVGCTTCHSGQSIGGQMYQKLGSIKPYKTQDTGRFQVTNKSRDKFKFKVPGLRNIEKTGPYFHDGSIKTLDRSIEIMAEYQLGKTLTKNEVSEIKAFLKSLTAKSVKY